MITNEELRQKVADISKQTGINAVEVATNPVALKRAAKTVTGLLPFVLRPLMKERKRGVILQIAERAPKPLGPRSPSRSPSLSRFVSLIED